MITTIEELSLNAWPTHQTVLYDGWVLRFADGYTKRANSVNPIYPSSIDVAEKIHFCEEIYQHKKLPVVFKITPAVYPGDLDERLSAEGYRIDSPTSVQVLTLDAADLQAAPDTNIREALSDEWLEGFCRLSKVSPPGREALSRILHNIIPRHCYVSIKTADGVIACGLGVMQSGQVGLFDIVTGEAFRGRGYARQVVSSILAWSRQNGAQKAYLQVMLNNPPALQLYAKIGFKETYQYWYRIKPAIPA